MAMVRKKQDDKYLEALRELITTGGGNRQCFDCGQKGPTYVNMTIGSFVCTRCSGVLRGITPPHRVKSISMATFTQDEIDFLKAHGNDVCAKTWLGLWDPKRVVHQDQRELMIDKYERKRYYLEPASPLKSLTNATNLKTNTGAATSSSSSSTTSTSASSSANNNQNNSNSNNNRSNTNNKTQPIQLTPPTSQRTTANGLHKTSSSAISRPQHSAVQAQNGFSSSHTDAFGLHNGLNSSVGSMSTGALSDTSSCASANGFGAEADFVADFGSADIFNAATVASSPASSVASSTNTNNGYAKIQPIKTAQQQFMNGHGGGGGGGNNSSLHNGNLSNGNTENFADFDHAPIYNAAVEEPSNYQFVRKNAIRKKSTSSISGSMVRRNERQLKDILEMDNNENVGDYINFNEDDDVFGEDTVANRKNNKTTTGYSNLFDDFDTLLTLDNSSSRQQQQQTKGFENDYANITKFTPLALAAHATAMAVLGNQSHFNQQQLPVFENTTTTTNTKPPSTFTTNQWDVWSQSTTKAAPPWYSYEQNPYATIGNYNARNLLTQQQQQQLHQMQQQQQQQQQQQYQQYFSSTNTFSATTPTNPSLPMTYDTGKTTISSMPPASLTTVTATATTTATSMFKQNNINTTTNPFRMHLGVNDNDNYHNSNNNIINYCNNNNNDYNFSKITTTTLPPTLSAVTATTATPNTIPIHFDYNFNNEQNFDFVSNSILPYDFQQIAASTAPPPPTTTTTLPITSTMATALPIQTYFPNDTKTNKTDFNYKENSYFNLDYNDVPNGHTSCLANSTTTFTANPFVYSLDENTHLKENSSLFPTTMTINTTTTSVSSYPSSSFSSSISSIYPSFNTTTTTAASNSFESCTQKIPNNPFIITATTTTTTHTPSTLLPQQSLFASSSQHHHEQQNSFLHQRVVDENANIAMMSSNNNVADYKQVVADNNTSNLNSNTNYNFNSYSNTNLNSNSNSYSYPNSKPKQNVNENLNANNSWRLPINNIKNNKNSTITNGFVNNNNSNKNNNNNINNNNSSAPAEDRYAALKDLDEQLRESKAVAAQAASIVTANVVDSGFGNPNVNGTVNPFAAHHHHHQQTSVVNPFQNASNNLTQNNATQQLFGQMTLIPNGIAAANGFLNPQKTHTANTGFFNYTTSGFTNANTPPQLQQQQQQQIQGSVMYPTSIQTGPNGCGFGFGTLQQQIASSGTGLTTNTFNNPFAATGALNSNNPFL